jgi:hypothetical protein
VTDGHSTRDATIAQVSITAEIRERDMKAEGWIKEIYIRGEKEAGIIKV